MPFQLEIKKGSSRVGKLMTKNGVMSTPFFMPDATRGFMRSMGKSDLDSIGVRPMVVNTYHLYLEPGMDIIKKAGGINNFMSWPHPLLSDSGGYQVFSLIHKNSEMGKITDKEVTFRSPLDGSLHKVSPEKSIEIQFDLGVDMMVVLDDPPPNDYSKEMIEKAVKRTVAWAKRCKAEYEKQLKKRKIKENDRPMIFGVIQGGKYVDLRKYCTEELVKIGFDGYGFGARHIDMEGNFMEEAVRETASFIPEDSLRFALGVGTPEDIIRCYCYGWDMFDCVIPTREGRHGRLFLRKSNFQFSIFNFQSISNDQISYNEKKESFYETININNGKFKDDFSPVDPDCSCELCQNYSRGYLRHIFQMKEPLAMRLASIHNLKFYMDLIEKLRHDGDKSVAKKT